MAFVECNEILEERAMKADRKLTKRLAQATNLINAINGGSIYPTFYTTTEEDHYRVEVSVPSVSPEELKIQLRNSNLLITHNIQIDAFTFPQILGNLRIAPEVNPNEIYAEFHDETLVVILPISTQSGGYDREIEIHKY